MKVILSAYWILATCGRRGGGKGDRGVRAGGNGTRADARRSRRGVDND